jgi:hypothetical protein
MVAICKFKKIEMLQDSPTIASCKPKHNIDIDKDYTESGSGSVATKTQGKIVLMKKNAIIVGTGDDTVNLASI